MLIETATERDVNEIATLHARIQELHVESAPWFFCEADAESLRDLVRESIENEDTRVMVARGNAGATVGYATGRIRRLPPSPIMLPHHALYIDAVAVEPSLRRSGIGASLVQEMCAVAKSEGLPQVGLDTWDFNRSAQAFFESLGFVPFVRRYIRKV